MLEKRQNAYKGRKPQHQIVKFPQIREKPLISPQMHQPIKSIKLEKINRKNNLALADLAKINRIQKQFAILTKRHKEQNSKENKKDQMRQSKLLLLKDIKYQQSAKKINQNLLSNLVFYHHDGDNVKTVNIPTSNITSSPTKNKQISQKQKFQQSIKAIQHPPPPTNYQNPKQLLKIDFVKMFIVEELLYYISKTKERSKQEMSGFCKFFNQNTDDSAHLIVHKVLSKDKDFLEAVFYERLGFYIFLILGTDSALQYQSSFLLNSLTDYLHTNNLIQLDLLMQIIDYENFQISSQFHVYNTSRFNQARRKLKNNEDKINLLIKNSFQLKQIIKGVLLDCGFQSLKNFAFEIIANQDVPILDKIKEVSLMLVSLDSILISSLEKEIQQLEKSKPKPPFLPEKQKPCKYTLVLDMDETLIHYSQKEDNINNFLIRPYCFEFLEEMSQHYELVIFTAAVKQYADSILNSLDKKGWLSHRLYRQHTRIEDYVSIKDLSLIGRDLSKAIIIDNIQSNFKLQPRNGIAISTWIGDPSDTSLYNLIPILKKLAQENINDVRDGLQALSQYMESKIEKGQEFDFDKLVLKGL